MLFGFASDRGSLVGKGCLACEHPMARSAAMESGFFDHLFIRLCLPCRLRISVFFTLKMPATSMKLCNERFLSGMKLAQLNLLQKALLQKALLQKALPVNTG